MGQCFNPDEMKAYYLCDPEKNTKCRKASCKHNPNAKHRVCDLPALGVLLGFVLRLITETVKLLLMGQ